MYRNIHTIQLKVYALYIYVHTCVYTYICVCASMHVCVHVHMFLYCDIRYVHPLFVLLHFTYPTFPHHSSPPLSLSSATSSHCSLRSAMVTTGWRGTSLMMPSAACATSPAVPRSVSPVRSVDGVEGW